MIRETCSCGATTEIDYGAHRASTQYPGEREAEAVATWRDCHRHEPPAPHEHRWICETAVCDPNVTWICECGATRTEPRAAEAAEADAETALDLLRSVCRHDWDHGPKDFHGPPLCRICGAYGDPAGGS